MFSERILKLFGLPITSSCQTSGLATNGESGKYKTRPMNWGTCTEAILGNVFVRFDIALGTYQEAPEHESLIFHWF